MKKVIIVALAIASLLACKKEHVVPDTNQGLKAQGFNPKYDEIKPLILAFKDAAELSNYGTSKTTALPDLTLAEAEWTLEGALNYDHAHPVQLYEDMHVDTLTITVSNDGTNSNGEIMVDGDALAQAYANLLAAIANLVPSGEDVEVIDIEAISHNNYFTTFKAYINSGNTLTLVPDYVKPDDDWRAAQGLGKCDGSMHGKDATNRLEQIINFNVANNFTLNLANPQQVIFYTNVVSLTNTLAPWDQSATDILDIRAWWGGLNAGAGHTFYDNSCGDCLDDQMMNMYLNRVWTSIYGAQVILQQQGIPSQGVAAANRDILHIDMTGIWPLGQGGPNLPGWHAAASATFGVPVL